MTARRGATAARRCATGLIATVLVATMLASCGDGTPPFCDALEDTADLTAISSALEEGDLETARAEAQRLRDLAADAPSEIRADFTALAGAVADIVVLLQRDERSRDSSEEGPAVGAADVERSRDELNSRFGDLDRRSTRVSTWAARECGIDLS
jgi:hypothetical protein